MSPRSAAIANDEGSQRSHRTAPALVAGQNHNRPPDHVAATQAPILEGLTLSPALPSLAPHVVAEQRGVSMLMVDLSASYQMQVS